MTVRTSLPAAVTAALAPLIALGAALDPRTVGAPMASIAARFRRELVRDRAAWHPTVG